MSPLTPSALQVNIERLCVQKEWDLSDLAEQSGVSLPYLSQLRSGARTNPRMKILREIARALGTTVAELTTEQPADEATADDKDDARVPAAS